MALKQLMLSKKIEQRKAELDVLLEQDAELQKRSADLETSIDEAKTDEEIALVEEEANKLEADQAELDQKKSKLEGEITALEGELEQLKSKDPGSAPQKNEREDRKSMKTRVKFYGMNIEERDMFFARDDVKNFIGEVRAIKTRSVTNAQLTIPDIMLEVLRDNMEQYSKLIKYVNVKRVNGTARQNIIGTVPEGVWMEVTGALNELDMAFNQIEVDGYMVGGIIWVHNTLLEDSDIALGSEVMEQLGQAIGKGIDRAILYGTGTKMPVGIVTRLAQTAEPADWDTNAPAWTDLHTANIKKLNIGTATGATFYASLITNLGIAKPNYSDGRVFWVMNRKTHIDLMTKALAFDAAAALIAGVNNQMPIIGGDIIELEMPGDYEIIGGFGSVYTLAERAGAKVDSSEHARFKEMLTGFRGYARYDGKPVFGEAFVMVSYDNSDAVTSSTFPTDYTNSDIGALAVTSAVSATTSGDTVITVVGTEATGTTLAYKIAGKAIDISNGVKPVGFTAWNGTAEITAATGKIITVVELNADGRAIKIGSCSVVAKA